MRRLMLVAGLAAFAAGCGESKFEPKELTDEQKRKVKEEDQKVLDEESGGKGYGEKAKARKK